MVCFGFFFFFFFHILNLKITLFSKKTNSQCFNLTDWGCKKSILTYPKKQQQQTNKQKSTLKPHTEVNQIVLGIRQRKNK